LFTRLSPSVLIAIGMSLLLAVLALLLYRKRRGAVPPAPTDAVG
jgi:LPXTG-motif cell wall-anchored protein